MKIADHAVEVMNREEISTVMWGDGILPEIAVAAGKTGHPLDLMGVVLNALERDARFEKMRIRGHDARCRQRVVRGFKLRPEYRCFVQPQ